MRWLSMDLYNTGRFSVYLCCYVTYVHSRITQQNDIERKKSLVRLGFDLCFSNQEGLTKKSFLYIYIYSIFVKSFFFFRFQVLKLIYKRQRDLNREQPLLIFLYTIRLGNLIWWRVILTMCSDR